MNKKLMLALIALAVLIACMLTVYVLTRPDTQDGAKEITVTVVHKDGSEKTFTYHTDAQYLDQVLQDEKLVTGEQTEYGLTVETVDGERANWDLDSAYWSLYIGEEYANTGVSQTPVTDGGTYKLVYTLFSE